MGALLAARAGLTVPTTTTYLLSETWTGTTGAAWPAQWSSIAVGGASGYSATIQSNAGQMNPGTVGYSGNREYVTSVTTGAFNAVITYTPTNQAEGYDAIVANTDGSVNGSNSFYPTNGYHLEIGNNTSAASCYLKLIKYAAGTSTTLVNNVTKTITAGTSYRLRFQRTGTTLQFRLWTLGSSEPGTWDGSATDSGTMLSSAGFYLAVGNGAATTAMPVTWDDLTVS